MVKSFIYLFIFFSLTVGGNSAEPNDIPTVWRIDMREPGNGNTKGYIFHDGFQPWGSNTDLIGHVSGNTCAAARNANRVPSSAFVAVTSVFNTIENFIKLYAIKRFRRGVQGMQTFYVYEIQPNLQFYSVNSSLERIIDDEASYSQAVRDNASNLLGDFSWQNEYVAVNGISESSIRTAQAYYWYSPDQNNPLGRVTTSAHIETNPNYVDVNGSHANRGPYIPPSVGAYVRRYAYRLNRVVVDSAGSVRRQMSLMACPLNVSTGSGESSPDPQAPVAENNLEQGLAGRVPGEL